MLEIEKKESKTLNTFQKLLEQISQSPQYNQSRQGQSSRENVQRKLPRTSQTYPEILVPYLNNSSEETIFGSNKIKEQHETMKLQNEVSSLKTLFINELEQTSLQQTVHK